MVLYLMSAGRLGDEQRIGKSIGQVITRTTTYKHRIDTDVILTEFKKVRGRGFGKTIRKA